MFKLARALAVGLVLAGAAACTSSRDDGAVCNPDDQDGVVGGNDVILLNVSDTAFAVGGLDSGSTEPNIAVQNLSNVTLTLTNVGTTPHGLYIACIQTGSPAGCPASSCFPDSANIPALAPGDSATVSFATPAVEGAYPFVSHEAYDAGTDADGGVSGLVGEF
ncbi:MAG TPA: hypothetical protein VGM29_19640, partial [Polyangiaceae bacterium]